MCEGDDGLLLFVERDLPHPVAYARRVIHHGVGIGVAVTVGFGDIEHTVGDILQRVSLYILEDGTVAVVDVDDVEVEPVGHLIVGVSRGVAHVDLVLAVALIFGIGSCSRALHDLFRPEVNGNIIMGIGHSDAGNGGMPVDAAPTYIYMVWVIAHDEGRGIGRVVGNGNGFLFAELGNITRLYRNAIPYLRLVGVAGVEYHHPLIGQDEEGGVVVVIGLEATAHQHLLLPVADEIYLCRLHVAMDIDIADVTGVNGAGGILIVGGTGVCKPAPSPLVGNLAWLRHCPGGDGEAGDG